MRLQLIPRCEGRILSGESFVIRLLIGFLTFVLLPDSQVKAQELPGENLQCGTVLPAGDSLDSLYARHQRFLEGLGGPVGLLGLKIIPVQFHIIRDDGGSGGPPGGEGGLLTELDMYVNPRYAGAGLVFVACAPANIVNSTEFQTLSDYTEGNTMASMYNVPNVLNIYVVDDPAGLCGWAWFTTDPYDYVVLAYDCATNTSTMAHEIGHYFDLFHTHETKFGDELVDGSNCTTAGDLICDTPADPILFDAGTMMYKVDLACMYTGTEMDANGQMYMPDPTNLMSYSRKDCRDNFTPLQLAKANYTADNGRSYVNLISCPPGT
ncbi:MAG: hypothetical protein KDC80_23280, partial [Saprospiraceae bacterium]|nr:hypothetical protein [Saprospiraceae bacterium]